VDRCRTIALDEHRPSSERTQAVQTLAFGTLEKSAPVLSKLLHPRNGAAVQAAAIAALDSFTHPDVANLLLAAWAHSQPTVRPRLLEAFLARPQRITALLEAIESSRIPAAEIAATYRARLLAHPDKTIAARAASLLAVSADRAQLVERYTREMTNLRGDPGRGRDLFSVACAACHRVGDTGYELGPSLPAFVARGPQAIVLNVLDPNREVNPQYVHYIVTTTDGRTLAGLIVSESDTALTLTAGGGIEHVLPRAQIASMTSTGQSLMPEGLEATISPQAMADLISFLTSAPH